MFGIFHKAVRERQKEDGQQPTGERELALYTFWACHTGPCPSDSWGRTVYSSPNDAHATPPPNSSFAKGWVTIRDPQGQGPCSLISKLPTLTYLTQYLTHKYYLNESITIRRGFLNLLLSSPITKHIKSTSLSWRSLNRWVVTTLD